MIKYYMENDKINTNTFNLSTVWKQYYLKALKRAKEKTGTCTIAIIGDSISQGIGASNLSTSNSSTIWTGLLRKYLQNKFGQKSENSFDAGRMKNL